jgi:hypothetical protein
MADHARRLAGQRAAMIDHLRGDLAAATAG